MTNVDVNSKLIVTNEVTMPGEHTESHNINEKYMGEVAKMQTMLESSTQIDQSTTVTPIANTSETNLSINVSRIFNVICVEC